MDLINERVGGAVLGVEPKTMQNWRVNGNGPPFYRLGRTIRYERNELIEWAKARRFTSTTEADAAASALGAAGERHPTEPEDKK